MDSIISIRKYEDEIAYFIKQNKFLLDQSTSRILKKFDNIEGEATIFQNKWFANRKDIYLSEYEHYDSSNLYEDSFNEAYGYYDLLSEMKKEVYLNTLSLIFHHWDKIFRQWLVKETKFTTTHVALKSLIWKMNFPQTIKLCELIGWQIKESNFYYHLVALKSIVNAYKHGNGSALNQLKQNYPEYFDQEHINNFEKEYIDHRYLKINLEQIKEFSLAIDSFWKNIPEHLEGDSNLIIAEVPKFR